MRNCEHVLVIVSGIMFIRYVRLRSAAALDQTTIAEAKYNFRWKMFASDALRQTKCFNFNQKQIKNVYEIALLGLHRVQTVVNTSDRKTHAEG